MGSRDGVLFRALRRARSEIAVYIRRRPEVILVPVSAIIILLTWEGIVRFFRIPDYTLPAPSMIVGALYRGFSFHVGPTLQQTLSNILYPGDYYIHILYTSAEALLGFVTGGVVGIVLGTLISQSRFVQRVLSPYIIALQCLPRLAVAPLFIIWFGVGITSKAVICGMATFFPLLINSITGFGASEASQQELMEALGATRWKTFVYLKVPTALPFIFAGLEIAVVYSFLGAIVGEFVGAKRGLGLLLLQMQFNMDIRGMFSVLVILAVLGMGFYAIVRLLRRYFIHWEALETRGT